MRDTVILKGVGHFDGWTEGRSLMRFPAHDSEAQWGPAEAVSPAHFSGQIRKRGWGSCCVSGRCVGSAARAAVDPASVQPPAGRCFTT